MEKKNSIETLSIQQAIVLGAVLIGVAILGGAYMLRHSLATGSGATTAIDTHAGTPISQIDIKNVNTEGEPFIGSDTAAVVIAYWSDYQCPTCKTFESTTLGTIIEKYVATGKVAVLFKDYATFGDDSLTAAVYARAVWNTHPNQYFAWRTAMIAAQDKVNQGFGNAESIEKLTATVAGIDVAKVHASVAAHGAAYKTAIEADLAEAGKLGVTGAPSFITGATFFAGAVSYTELSGALDAQIR